MASTAEIMRELHRHRKHASDLSTELDRGPRTLRAHETRVAKQEELLREAQETLKHLKVSIHDKEISLKMKQQEIAKHQKQLNEAGGKKAYDALQLEIANEKKACRKLEDEVLEAMEEVEIRTGKLPELEKEIQRSKQETVKLIDDIQTRRNILTDRLNEMHKKLAEVEASLPEDIRIQYERLVSSRGAEALSLIQGRTCTACYTEITAQNYNDLLQGKFLLCKSCGRILYLPEKPAGEDL